MSTTFNVAVKYGTGHADLDTEGDIGESASPTMFSFSTEGERAAFLRGIDLATSVMDGFVDAWVEARSA
jgi:hypothetical protein